MEGLSIEEISRIVGGETGESTQDLLWVQPGGASVDSRTIANRDVFFALKGQHTDGHGFVEQALRSGACAAVVRRDWMQGQRRPFPGMLIGVKDPLKALQELARKYRQRFRIPVVAVSGSNGKTTTKDMAACVLRTANCVAKTQGNYNNHIGVPLTILSLTSGHQVAVMELGTSGPGQLASLCELAAPSVGVITNVGPVHLEFFGSVEQIADAKGELLAYLPASGTAVLNGDDPLVLAQSPRMRGKTVTFGLGDGCDFRAEAVHCDPAGGSRFTVQDTSFRLSVPGQANVYNALAAISIGSVLGVPLKDAQSALAQFQPPPMRLEFLERRGIGIINDAYNANPISTRAALEVLAATPKAGHGRRIAVLGDMLELGPTAEHLHRELGRHLAESGVSHAFLIGVLSQFTYQGARDAGMSAQQVEHFSDRSSAVRRIRDSCAPGDLVLVKGSRAMRMETIVEAIGSLL